VGLRSNAVRWSRAATTPLTRRTGTGCLACKCMKLLENAFGSPCHPGRLGRFGPSIDHRGSIGRIESLTGPPPSRLGGGALARGTFGGRGEGHDPIAPKPLGFIQRYVRRSHELFGFVAGNVLGRRNAETYGNGNYVAVGPGL